MNMQKLGILGQSEKGFRNRANPMNTGLRAIHYANIRDRQNGLFCGMILTLALKAAWAARRSTTAGIGKQEMRSLRFPAKPVLIMVLAAACGMNAPLIWCALLLLIWFYVGPDTQTLRSCCCLAHCIILELHLFPFLMGGQSSQRLSDFKITGQKADTNPC